MNILYIHGLDSKLNMEKKKMLEKYGKVFAPDLDYYQNRNAIDSILKMYSEVDINTVIGSSMGGFAGYYISNALDRPALLFNPALQSRSVEQIVPKIEKTSNSFKQIVIGQRDEVVDPKDTLLFISRQLSGQTDFHLNIRHEMEHRVHPECFEEELEIFFFKLCY